MRDGKEVTSMDTVAEMLDADFFQAKIGDEPSSFGNMNRSVL